MMADCTLTERIKFQLIADSVVNANGFENEEWSEYYKCWASKEDVSGREYMRVQATQTEVLVGFTVRMCQKIRDILAHYQTKKYRIVHRGNIYDIQYCHDIKNKHTFAEFKCKLVI